MAEIFDKMKVEFIDQDESVQVIADNICETGEVPERYVRSEIKADPVIVNAEGYNLPVIDMSRLLNPEFSEEETAKLGSACEHWGFFQVCVLAYAIMHTHKFYLTVYLSFCTTSLYFIYPYDDYTFKLFFLLQIHWRSKGRSIISSVTPPLTLITAN